MTDWRWDGAIGKGLDMGFMKRGKQKGRGKKG